MLFRLLERYPPSLLLIEVAAGIGTFIGGLKFALIFLLGVGVAWLGAKLDTRGITDL